MLLFRQMTDSEIPPEISEIPNQRCRQKDRFFIDVVRCAARYRCYLRIASISHPPQLLQLSTVSY
uniref:Uncharacterized protein n=1 Tax=Picea glauca TaxID=3330 RepID=A0A101M1A8_PICGL|nr:hypothetical protein ABT39_MTgene3641 [Picea glauca]QHR86409.1 hypothetical protein Q903MT_gene408 [Picea sitchensis]